MPPAAAPPQPYTPPWGVLQVASPRLASHRTPGAARLSHPGVTTRKLDPIFAFGSEEFELDFFLPFCVIDVEEKEEEEDEEEEERT